MDSQECENMNQRITDMGADVHTHIRKLSDKFDTHHTMLTTHIDHFQKHEQDEIQRHDQFIESQSLNTKAINDLTNSVSGVVETYKTANSLGKFVKWSSGIVIGLGIIWTYFFKQ